MREIARSRRREKISLDIPFYRTSHVLVSGELGGATSTTCPTSRQSDGRALPGLIVFCFGQFWVRGLPFPNARHMGHPSQWKNTLLWHLGPAANVRILRFKNLPRLRHYPLL